MKIPFIQERIFQHYFPSCNLKGKNTISPFRKDTNPSFCIKKVNTWYVWTDWGLNERGNCFDFVAKLNGLHTKLHFNLILNIICKDLGLTYLFNINEKAINTLIQMNKSVNNSFKVAYDIKTNDKLKIRFKKKLFNLDEIEYWKSQGMLFNDSLFYFDIYSVSEAYIVTTNHVSNIYNYSQYKTINDINVKKLFYCFAYKYGKEFVKLYRPYHFDKWKSTVPHNLVCTKTIFGNDTLIITKAKKEQMHLFDVSRYIIDKFDILPLNNESTFLDWYYNQIKDKYKKIILWLDSDIPGINAMLKLSSKYNMIYHYSQFGKNITDIYNDNYLKLDLTNNIKNSLCQIKEALSSQRQK